MKLYGVSEYFFIADWEYFFNIVNLMSLVFLPDATASQRNNRSARNGSDAVGSRGVAKLDRPQGSE